MCIVIIVNLLNFATKQLHAKENAQKLAESKKCFPFHWG